MLAEWLKAKNTGIQVIGCPKTIDGDLKMTRLKFHSVLIQQQNLC